MIDWSTGGAVMDWEGLPITSCALSTRVRSPVRSRCGDRASRAFAGRPIASDGPVVAQRRRTIGPDLVVHEYAGQRKALEDSGVQLGISWNAPVPLAPEEIALIDELQRQSREPTRTGCYGGLPLVVLAPSGIGVELQHRAVDADWVR